MNKYDETTPQKGGQLGLRRFIAHLSRNPLPKRDRN